MKKLLLLLILSSALSSCGRLSNQDEKQDQKERIVYIAKQYTEIIFALGREKNSS